MVNGNPLHIRPDLTLPHRSGMFPYPVVIAPIGRALNSVPIGMQIIADTFEDLNAFQVAANLPNSFSGEKPILNEIKRLMHWQTMIQSCTRTRSEC